jgi:plastocyanin
MTVCAWQPGASMRLVALATLACLPAFACAAALEVRVVDAAGKPLPEAVIYLESDQARAAVKPAPVTEIAQVQKRFDPKVTVIPVGSAVNFPNRDTVRHHVYSFSPARKFEIKLYVGTPATPVVFDRPGIAVLGCNIHDDMAAWVVAVDTPWFGKTGGDGRVSLPAVPSGSYRLRAWHPDLPADAPPADQAQTVGTSPQTAAVRLAVAAR